ncbi:MAG: acyl-protein synthase [Pseudomonas sp.]
MITSIHSDALCALKEPYLSNATTDKLFDQAMREITDFHCRYSPGYQQWLLANGLQQTDIAQLEDWSRLPPIFANYFKHRLLLSDTAADALELTSSGTGGQKSRMRYDDRSLKACQGMVDRIFEFYGWHTPDTPCNYLILGYEPAGASTLGTSYTDQFLLKYAPVNQVGYALRHNGESHEFDPFGVIRTIQEFAAQGLPVRIFGFPAFLWLILKRMRELNYPTLQLHPDSLVLLGGGWKTHHAQEIPKAMLYRRVSEQLGIADERCRDGYGAVEHPVPYIECKHHHLHVPVYARAFARHPHDFSVNAYGESGLLHLISPYITSSPAHSVVMSDRVIVHRAEQCGCGIQSDWIEILGRAGTAASRSCALAASELIKGN